MKVGCICGEQEALEGVQTDAGIKLACLSCGHTWLRDASRTCDRCSGDDLQIVPLAIVEKGRGTQLSVVGVRPVTLCSACDAGRLRKYHDSRPNPLMPDELPTVAPEDKLQ